MAVAAVSEDGTKRIRPVVLDGHPKYYLESRGHQGRWYFDGQFHSIDDLAKKVDLSTFSMG